MSDRVRKEDAIRERDGQADLIRVIACLLFIAVHTRGAVTKPYPNVEYWLKPLIIICNPLFFMLSGKFALRPFQDNSEGYKQYYLKKLETIVIPYIVICIFIFWWNNGFQLFDVKEFITCILNDSLSYQMWFMGPMIGLKLSAPFLSAMVNNLSNTGRKTLIGIGFCWNLITINVLTNMFHMAWGYSHWILVSWLLYFVLGYCIEEVTDRKTIGFICMGGVLCYFLTVLQKQYLPPESQRGIEDHSAIFVLYSSAIYLLLNRVVLIKNATLKKVLAFISSRVFYIFLIHVNIIKELDKVGFDISTSPWISYFVKIVTVFMVSLCLAWLIERSYKLLIRLFKTISKRKLFLRNGTDR